MKFEKLKPGMVLYDVHSEPLGNTTMRTIGVWEVRVISIHPNEKLPWCSYAMCSWNTNKPEMYGRERIEKLRVKKPVLVKIGWGRRLARRGEVVVDEKVVEVKK